MKNSCKIISVLLAVAILMTMFSLPAFAKEQAGGTVYYVDSVTGSDDNDGISMSAPWKTLAKVGAVIFEAGDQILFKRGCTFVGTVELHGCGTAENPIVFGAYGEGAKPLLTTMENTEAIRMFDLSYWTLKDFELTAHNGGGIWIDTLDAESNGITIDNVTAHDIQNTQVDCRDNLSQGAAAARAFLMIKGMPARSRYAVNNLTVSNCEVYDCGNGISIWGSWNDQQNPWCEWDEADPIRNENVVIENCSFTNLDAEAILIGMCDGAIARNCSAIDCCQGGADVRTYCTAAVWFWGSENSIVENCEIAGQKNFGDGMAIDFDSRTNNSTYQYIYSHDNIRFMCNCPYDKGQFNNTVRYCLSVNDNVGDSKGGGSAGENNFKFYNNTLINCANIEFQYNNNASIKNNIFYLKKGCSLVFKTNKTADVSNNCYYQIWKPLKDSTSMIANPQFAGGDVYDVNSYVLKKCSPLIGAGVQVEEDMGKYDFFGNALTDTHNIGCYDAEGVDGEKEEISTIQYVKDLFRTFYEYLTSLIVNQINHDVVWFNKTFGTNIPLIDI